MGVTPGHFTMRGVLLFLYAALAVSQNISYEPGLNPQKTYEYKYEGVITIGRNMPDLAESGVRMTCSVKIIGVSAQTFLLQVANMAFEEFNGFPGRSEFSPSPKLTERIAAQLSKPIMFEYVKGRVGDIRAAADVSDTVVNIVRGILGFLQITIKTTQSVYEVKEIGIHGICQSIYFIEENTSSKELYVTQVVDINNCQGKAEIWSGVALALKNKNCKERGENLKTTVKYIYTVRPTDNGALITKAHADELQFFSPFNVKGGNSKVKASKTLVLVSVTDNVQNPVIGPLQNRGDLIYKFGNELNQIPLVLKKLDDPVAKISELIPRLANANIKEVDAIASTDVLDLYQLLRVTALENLETLWKQLSGNLEHRRWLLDTVVEVTDARVIKFLITRFQKADVTPNEAGQTLLVALNHVTADANTLELSKEFLTMPFSKSTELLWSIVTMSYGSLVYRFCSNIEPCPVAAVQPLLDLAVDGLTKGSEEGMVLALKSLGNAGHPSSIKTIMKFLPGISATGAVLPTHVLNAAVQSLRLIAIKEPHTVQDIVIRLFVQTDLPSEVRMLACVILFDTKPSFALVSTLTTFLLEEPSLEVAGFSYSLMQGFARSHTPDNHYVSIACDVAVKILARKLGHFTFRHSKAVTWDWFNDDFLFGTAGQLFIIGKSASSFPTAITFRGKAFFIGRILQLQELGIRAEGIRELFNPIPPINGKHHINKIGAILKMLSDWQSLPKDKPLLSSFARTFGQEVFYIDVNKDMIQRAIEALNPFAGKESPVWKDFQKGIAWHWTKPYLVFETRYMQATSLGLPVEISKYYSSVTGITANAKATISPPPSDKLGQLLNSDISMETDGNARCVKDVFVFHGINTDIVQSGVEFQSKMIINMPWQFAMKLNVKAKKFQIDVSPCQKDTELVSENFNIYAVSRNIEDPSRAIMTPMMADPVENNQNLQLFTQETGISGQEQMGSVSEVDHTQTRMCAEANTYGTAICIEGEAKRAHYTDEYPLYYFLGNTHFAFKLEPAQTKKAIDKIHIEVNVGKGGDVQTLSQMIELVRKNSKNATWTLGSSTSPDSRKSHHSGHHEHRSSTSQLLDVTPDPVVTLMALAMSGSAKPDGYEAAAYFTKAAEKDDIQLLVSQVGEEANWKLCSDANVDKIHSKTKIYLRWGAECQTYKMVVRAATSHLPGSKRTFYTKIHWDNVPVYMKEVAKRVQAYIPGMALILGFYQKHAKNPENEVSAVVTEASSQYFDLKIKIPELTVYRQAIPTPFPIPEFEEIFQNAEEFRELPFVMFKDLKAQCSISGNKFKTFNNVRFKAAMPKDCYLVVAQDCTTDLNFLVLMREDMNNRTEISVRMPIGSLKMNYEHSGVPLMKLNDSPVLLSALPLKDASGTLLIDKSQDGIIIEAPTLGLHSLYFNGKTIKVEIESWMRGKTCGLCGQADGEKNTEFRKPNLQIAKSPISFLSSWVLQGEACSDTCSLRRQPVKVVKAVSILGTQSSCHSVEPILQCREGCSATSTVEQSVGFHCAPLSTAVTPRPTFDLRTAHVEEFVDAHISCLCNTNECKH